MEPESALEKVAGSPITDIGATLLAAFSGNPVAALLPSLAGALASERHKQRVENAIREIGALLRANETRVRQISDAQYKIINESVLALFQTVEQRKIEYLKNVISRTLFLQDAAILEADALSRVLRDISAAEARFLLDNADAAAIQIAGPGIAPQPHVHFIKSDSPEVLIVSGLMAMGLLLPGDPTWDAPNRMIFSPICKKLRELLS